MANDTISGSEERGFIYRSVFDDIEGMYTRVRDTALSLGLAETLKALEYARKMHAGQFRKSYRSLEKIPYIYHPLTMACHALALGITADDVLAAILLHDVYEDCPVSLGMLPVNDSIRHTVFLLSHNAYEGPKEERERAYFTNIALDSTASLIKCLDRCQNLSSMADGFPPEKIIRYINETERYILPIAEKLPELAPEYANAAWLLRYHMVSLLEMAKRLL
ncbi:MAG: HD domain-containing protein [Clostridia bacterium]|nr:HD domain-containing protein [Clostridia bacterium]